LEFDARTYQLAEVVARAQARLDAFGATKARAVQQADRIVIDLPAGLASKRSEIEALLTRPHELAFAIVENNSPLMIDLYGRLEQDPRSHELGVFREIGSWQRNDATHAVESDPFLEGRREALEKYLEGRLDAAARHDPDHTFRFSPVPDRPKLWRTEYVDLRTQVRITRALEASVERSDRQEGGDSVELAFRLLPADGARLRALSGGHIGKKMVVTVDGEVLSTPVIEGVVGDRGRMTMSDEQLARRLAAALVGGALLVPLTVAHSPPQPVVGLGNLNVIGLGGPSPHCDHMPDAPSLSLSFSRAGFWPGEQEICGALRGVARKIEACHLSALRSRASSPTRLSISLVADDRGNVARPTPDEHTRSYDSSPLEACLLRATRHLNFGPRKSWDGQLTLWFHFR
jgi:hypothetical protein